MEGAAAGCELSAPVPLATLRSPMLTPPAGRQRAAAPGSNSESRGWDGPQSREALLSHGRCVASATMSCWLLAAGCLHVAPLARVHAANSHFEMLSSFATSLGNVTLFQEPFRGAEEQPSPHVASNLIAFHGHTIPRRSARRLACSRLAFIERW